MKRIGVDKTNARTVVITAGASFLVVFFLVASFSLFSQLRYQNRIIGAKKKAVTLLKANVKASDSLVASYKTFAIQPQNFIGGNADGQGGQDGSNAKITLDALPSKYDFPALTASLEKIATDQRVSIQDITGNDDEVSQLANQSSNSPQPVEIPFEIKLSGDYAAIQRFVVALERSIRPIQIQTMQVTGDPQTLTLHLTAKTFYQPEKTLNIRTTVVK
jgi:Tfp pilus assembly protein PilO